MRVSCSLIFRRSVMGTLHGGWITGTLVDPYICDTTQTLKHVVVLFKQGHMIISNSVYALYKVHFYACWKS